MFTWEKYLLQELLFVWIMLLRLSLTFDSSNSFPLITLCVIFMCITLFDFSLGFTEWRKVEIKIYEVCEVSENVTKIDSL